MAIDAYSLCPGGTGKKIKFCCSDLQPELEKIDRMLEGDQLRACLTHVERLLEKTPSRACLLATKCLLLRLNGEVAAARTTAGEFAQHHPGNPVALAELAMATAATEGGRAAVAIEQQALAAAGKEVPPRVYEMLGMVGQVLLMEGELLAGRAILSLQAAIDPNDRDPIELIARTNLAPDVPLWVKDQRRLMDAPADAPWRSDFEEAIRPAAVGQWLEAAQRLEALAARVGDQPAVWRNVGALRAWSADRAGAIVALRKYVALAPPLEDAVEAEALALYLSEDPLGDWLEVLDLEYAVADVEALPVRLASDPRMGQLPVDLGAVAEGDEPPPRALFVICDRPMPATAQGITLQVIPRSLCQAALFGRETAREARLEVIGVIRDDLEKVKTILAEAAGDALGAPVKEEVVEHTSATLEVLNRRWRLPRDMDPAQYRELAEQQENEVFLSAWPRLQLGIFGGKTPEEAAKEPSYRVRLLAVIALVEAWGTTGGLRFDFGRLLERLGLPHPEAVDPSQVEPERVPIARLHRLTVERLSDEALLTVYRRALALNATAAMRKFAQAIVDRPALADRDESWRAYATLARTAVDSDQSLVHIDQGRKAAEAAGRSTATWDVMELSYRLDRGEGQEAGRLLEHLEREHLREPGVGPAVQQLLVRHGLLRPDGMPSVPAEAPSQPAAGIVVPGATAEPGALWTPEGAKPAGEKPKIWVPGME